MTFPDHRQRLAQRDKRLEAGRPPKDSRRRDFSQRLPVSLGFTKQQNLERFDATLTCVDGRGRAVPAFPRNPPSRTAQQHPVRVVCHAPSKVLPGLHGSIGPPSAFATASSGPVGLRHQRRSSLRPKSAGTSTGLSQCLSAFSADQAGFTEGPEMTDCRAGYVLRETCDSLWKAGLSGMKRVENGGTQVCPLAEPLARSPVRGSQRFTVRANSIFALSSRECRDVVVRNADVGEQCFGGVVQPVRCHQQRFALGPTP